MRSVVASEETLKSPAVVLEQVTNTNFDTTDNNSPLNSSISYVFPCFPSHTHHERTRPMSFVKLSIFGTSFEVSTFGTSFIVDTHAEPPRSGHYSLCRPSTSRNGYVNLLVSRNSYLTLSRSLWPRLVCSKSLVVLSIELHLLYPARRRTS